MLQFLCSIMELQCGSVRAWGGEGGLTGAGSVMVTFVSPGGAAGVLFTPVTFNSQP